MECSVQISNYSSTTYDSLLEFNEAKVNAKIDSDKIVQLGDIICKHKLHKKIGLGLLHKHFDIQNNEVLVRKVTDNVANTSPQLNSDKEMVSYLWKIEQDTNAECVNLMPLEFIEYKTDLKAVKKISKITNLVCCNTGFLNEFSEKIIELNLSDTFGISILNSCFLSKNTDETFLETTDESNKQLTLKPASMKMLSDKTIQTQWVFTPSNSTIGTACTHCGHCRHSPEGNCYHQ